MPDFVVSPIERIINRDAVIQKLDLSEHEGNKRFIAGYANIAGIKDSQDDVVTLEALQNAWSKWKSNPDFCILSLLHTNVPMAKVWFDEVTDTAGRTHRSGMDERGLYIVAQVRDDVTLSDDVWNDIKSGKYRGFSIGGKNLNPQPEICRAGVCTKDITDFELYEVGIVDQPANEVSIFNVLKCDDLAKLAEDTKHLTEKILVEDFAKVSKKPCPNGKHYHVLIKSGFGLETILNDESFTIITEPVEGEEYVTLFDLALLRPHGVLSAEKRNGGFNPSPLEEEPKKGETPLSENLEEVIEESTSDSQESETPETQVDEPAIAPITIETLAADLARVIERLENMEKNLPEEKAKYPWGKCMKDRQAEGYSEERARKICGSIRARTVSHAKKFHGFETDKEAYDFILDKAENDELFSYTLDKAIEIAINTEKIEKSAETGEKPVETEPVKPEALTMEQLQAQIVSIEARLPPEEKPQVIEGAKSVEIPETEMPVTPEPTVAQVKPLEATPAPKPEPKPEPVEPEKIETRGVAVQVVDRPAKPDIASIHPVSWDEIRRERKKVRM